MIKPGYLIPVVLLIFSSSACDSHKGKHKSPPTAAEIARHASTTHDGPHVYIVSPSDGQTLQSPVTVIFGLSGMGVAPAGVSKEGTGHHHLLIDVDELPPLDVPLPSTDQIRHFGGGQTQTQVELAPGEHTLQLLLGDFAHVPHEKPLMSNKIRITVVGSLD